MRWYSGWVCHMTKAKMHKRNTDWFYFEVKARSRKQAREKLERMLKPSMSVASIERI